MDTYPNEGANLVNTPSPVKRLAMLMKARQATKPPYTLLLGAGASKPSGYPDGREFVERFIRRFGYEPTGMSDDEKREAFQVEWESAGSDNQEVLIQELLPDVPASLGYNALSYLCQQGYFQVVVSTNPDDLLEQALSSIGGRTRFYEPLVVGKDRDEYIRGRLGTLTPPVKVLKLHGDIFAGSLKFTAKEIERFPDPIDRIVSHLVSDDLIVVGHALEDPDLRRCFEERAGSAKSMWYASKDTPSPWVQETMSNRGGSHNVLSGAEGDFDRFFSELAIELGGLNTRQQGFESNLGSGTLTGLRSEYGPYGLTGAHLWLGEDRVHSCIGLPVWLDRGTVEVKLQVSPGGDQSSWAGLLVKASSSLWSTGYLIYLRRNGDLEVLAKGQTVLAITRVDTALSEHHLKVSFQADQLQIVCDEGQPTSTRLVVQHQGLTSPAGFVYLYSLECRGIFSDIKCIPLPPDAHSTSARPPALAGP